MRKKSTYAAISLLCLGVLFCALMLTNIIVSIVLYNSVREKVDWSRECRLATSYISTKLKSNDHADGIAIDKFDGEDAIFLYQLVGDETYVDIMYVHDGWLKELLCSEADMSGVEPGDGVAVLPLTSMDVSIHNDLVSVTVVGRNDVTNYVSYFVRSGRYHEKEQ